MKILIKGGTLLNPADKIEQATDILVNEGLIEEVGKGLGSQGASVIDADGAYVGPGFVDLHVHLREPGREDEETIETGSRAAAAGGFTCIVAMPNTDPVCDNAAVAEKVAGRGRMVGLVDVIPAGAITKDLAGKHLSPIGEMVQSSARVRMFTDDGKGVSDSRLLRRAMEYIRGFDGVCAEHCEDASLSEGGQMNEGEFSDSLGLKGIPAEAEEVALGRDLALAGLTGVRFHALHISTAGSVELIRAAKRSGIRVTAEASPHHISLTDSELISYDPVFKVNPPLRSQADVEALKQGLVDGTIDALATDHAPHSPEEKEAEFELAPPGMIGLETALAVAITELVKPGLISLSKLVELMSSGPARILGLTDQGGPVVAGAPANLVVFDPSAEWVVDTGSMHSMSRNSPWQDRALTGKVLATVFNGSISYDSNRVLAGAGL